MFMSNRLYACAEASMLVFTRRVDNSCVRASTGDASGVALARLFEDIGVSLLVA